ncbi:MAG: radical SAM protein, partial [Candidatus Omnitrophica bacterium]|nr:radical SAM protein [Candidatus Omnitrophota bacterium]
ELARIKKHLNFIRIFKFADDLFMALPEETLKEFCRLYKESGLGLPLDITGVHPLILKEDKFKLLVAAGLKYVRMGIQSGSHNIRRLYGRSESDNKILESAGIIHKYKNRLKAICYDFMVDNPWETTEDIKDSLRLLVQIPRPYRINLFSLTLYPGTELYNKAKQEGIVSNEGFQIYDKHYHDNVNTSYYNGLFKIIPIYRLPKRCFIFLINHKSNLLAKIICFILLKGINPVVRLARLKYLIDEGVRDAVSGDFERVNKFIFRQSKVVH